MRPTPWMLLLVGAVSMSVACGGTNTTNGPADAAAHTGGAGGYSGTGGGAGSSPVGTGGGGGASGTGGVIATGGLQGGGGQGPSAGGRSGAAGDTGRLDGSASDGAYDSGATLDAPTAVDTTQVDGGAGPAVDTNAPLDVGKDVALDLGAGEAGSAACDTIVDETVCQARSDCHLVFEDPGTCNCLALGCCARFKACAAGALTDCSGPATCKMMEPFCEGPYVVAYAGSCYEGCARKTDCAF